MATITLTVTDKVLKAQTDGQLVCDNDTDSVCFVFDDMWDTHKVRTARFAWNGDYTDIPFEGDTVAIPEIRDTDYMEIGVYTDGLTTTPARVRYKRSIKSNGGVAVAPAGDVYEKIVALMNEIEPVKGVDYWTNADKAEIVSDVLAALPTWEGGSY